MRPYAVEVLPYCSSGGIRALYQLVHELNVRGAPAVAVRVSDPMWTACALAFGARPLPARLTCPVVGEVPEDAILIGPDHAVTTGSRFVRWHLASPRDCVGGHADDYYWCTGPGDARKRLWLPRIFEPFFAPPPLGSTRSGVAIWRGKGHPPFDLPEGIGGHKNGFLLTTREPDTREQLAALLQSVELLVSFDAFSGTVMEATMCGTPVLMAGEAREHRDKYASLRPSLPGVAWSEEEIPAARDAAQRSHEVFWACAKAADSDVGCFIAETQLRFGADVAWPAT